MPEAREIMDRVTSAALAGDLAVVRQCYAEDAVCDTPEGRLEGRDAIAEYLIAFSRAFPDLEFEHIRKSDAGDTAIDEGYVLGTNTGPITTPQGEVPATGKRVRVRECDVLTARDGVAVEHRFYYDQLGFLTQLGLHGQQPLVPEQEERAQTGTPART